MQCLWGKVGADKARCREGLVEIRLKMSLVRGTSL